MEFSGGKEGGFRIVRGLHFILRPFVTCSAKMYSSGIMYGLPVSTYQIISNRVVLNGPKSNDLRR